MVEIIKSGFFSTLQDLGRFGFRDKGVPVSGAMDSFSALLANELLGNNPNDAILEITMAGPELLFHEHTEIVLAGAPIDVFLDKFSLPMHHVVEINPGQKLSFGHVQKGFRTYLAVKGGWQTEAILGSRSLFKPITPKSHIDKGSTLNYLPFDETFELNANLKMKNDFLFDKTIEVFPGPEFDLLKEEDRNRLAEFTFHVDSLNNRMAYQLQEKLSKNAHSITTSATLPGTVQLTPSGKLIVLMRDAQTTGGYPRILQLSERAICVLAQKKTGDAIRLKMV
jgi:biotin-dependent carboxylase-like uncharacterized protein